MQTNLTNSKAVLALTGSIFSVPRLGIANFLGYLLSVNALLPSRDYNSHAFLESRHVFPQVLLLKGSAVSPTANFQIFLYFWIREVTHYPKAKKVKNGVGSRKENLNNNKKKSSDRREFSK